MRLWYLFLYILLFACSNISETTSVSSASSVGESIDVMSSVQKDTTSELLCQAISFEESYFAELGGLFTPFSYSSFLRLQRNHYSEIYCALRFILSRISSRFIDLSNIQINLSSFSTFFRCQPVCKYYIFTLRRILI